MSISRERLGLALERLQGGDWQAFEQFASEFLAADYPGLFTMASPSGDGGRDAELFGTAEDNAVALQYSVAADWETKIKKTAKRLEGEFPRINVIVYATNQRVGALADPLRAQFRKQKKFTLAIFDSDWFLERRNSSPVREDVSERLAVRMVDPLLAETGKKGITSPLTSAEARAALVYLELQLKDDNRDKGLTKLCFDALVRMVVQETTPESRISRIELRRRVREIISSHSGGEVDRFTDAAIARMNKKYLRHWMKEDEFCLAFKERERIRTLLTAREYADRELTSEISVAVRNATAGATLVDSETEALSVRARRVLESFLLARGEVFVEAVARGEFGNISSELLAEIVLKDTAEHGYSGALRGTLHDVLRSAVLDVLANPGEAVRAHLKGLADAYTLLAFLKETPDVQSAVVKMFSDGEIWLDTSVLLPVFLETLVGPESKEFTNMLAAAREAGCELRMTDGVLEELDTHIGRALACVRERPEVAWRDSIAPGWVRDVRAARGSIWRLAGSIPRSQASGRRSEGMAIRRGRGRTGRSARGSGACAGGVETSRTDDLP